jgi:hypothetical protein
MTKYYWLKNGEWVTPTPIHKMACCDCGLVHTMHFRIALVEKLNGKKHGKPTVQFKAFRDNQATAKRRKLKKLHRVRRALA